jgi:hypothetical protein
MNARMIIAAILFTAPQIALAQTPMTRSKLCTTHMQFMFAGKAAPPPSTIQMTNDGWCWFDTTSLPNATATFAAPLRVTRQPMHGQVTIEASPVQGKTRVAYRPTPGFTGGDSFAVINETTNNERQVDVTIQ